METSLTKLFEQYKQKVDINIKLEDFKHPKSFIEHHETLVGTVIKHYNKNLRIYDHIIYFGCMLFFQYLTDEQIRNGPVVYDDLEGNACCM